MVEQVEGTPEEPVSCDDVLESVRDPAVRANGAIWAAGISAPTGARRAGWIAVVGGDPTLVFDGWVAPQTFETVSEHLEERDDSHVGIWDVMYADQWRHTWGRGAGTFRLIDRRGGTVKIRDGEVRIAFGPWWQHVFRDSRVVSTDEVGAARKRTRYDGVLNEVCLDLETGESIPVASRWNWGPVVDVGYDALMHDLDTRWARRLADDLRRQLDDG